MKPELCGAEWPGRERNAGFQRRAPHNRRLRISAHVGCTGRQPDPHARWRCDHPRSAVITRRSITRLTSRPIRMAVPSVSVTSIPPPAVSASVRHAGGSVCRLGSSGRGSLVNCTGRNTGAGSGPSVPQRTWWRQFHNKPRLRSCRRATSTKLAPGCSSSATIRSLSSNRQRRRRSDPVIISIPIVVPVLNGALTSAVKIIGSIQHHKAALAGRIPLGIQEMRRSGSTSALRHAPDRSSGPR